MCVICKLWQQEIITTKEAKKATWELVNIEDVSEEHLQDLYAKLEKEEERRDDNE